MNLAKLDFYRIRELVAEKGRELTPEQLKNFFIGRLGYLNLTDDLAITTIVGKGNELENKFFNYIIEVIIQEYK